MGGLFRVCDFVVCLCVVVLDLERREPVGGRGIGKMKGRDGGGMVGGNAARLCSAVAVLYWERKRGVDVSDGVGTGIDIVQKDSGSHTADRRRWTELPVRRRVGGFYSTALYNTREQYS